MRSPREHAGTHRPGAPRGARRRREHDRPRDDRRKRARAGTMRVKREHGRALERGGGRAGKTFHPREGAKGAWPPSSALLALPAGSPLPDPAVPRNTEVHGQTSRFVPGAAPPSLAAPCAGRSRSILGAPPTVSRAIAAAPATVMVDREGAGTRQTKAAPSSKPRCLLSGRDVGRECQLGNRRTFVIAPEHSH